MWDLIVSVPDHCLSFYFRIRSNYIILMIENVFKQCYNAIPRNTAKYIPLLLGVGNLFLEIMYIILGKIVWFVGSTKMF